MGRPGQIVTFYSYKGGTGRSMLLANVAWILASNGHRVLVIDWDLEAPGLHRFFRPFLPDVDLHETEGVIDFVLDFSVAAITPTGEGGSDDSTWFHPYADLTAYTVPLHWDFPGDGRLDFVGAGRQGPSYSSRVNGFNWQEFYDRFGGGALLDRMREVLKSRYDYIIVDSRTGISDTSGICTVQLPDVLVVCFTLNNQSVEGASAVARSVQAQTNGAVRILPVPTRVERSEKDKLNLRREDAMRRFGPLLEGVTRGERDEYWTDVEVLYEPYYAYEEILATFKDRPGERHTILASAEHLATRVVGETVRALHVSEGRRQAVLANYEGVPVRAAPVQGRDLPGVFIGYQRTEGGYAGKLYDRLVRTFGADRTFIDVSTLEPGADVATVVGEAIQASGVALILIGPRTSFDDPGDVLGVAVTAALRLDKRVIPVLVEGASLPAVSELPGDMQALARRQAVELTDSRWDQDVDRLVAAIELAVSRKVIAPAVDAQGQASTERAIVTSAKSDQLIDEVLRTKTHRRAGWITGIVGVTLALVLAVFAVFALRNADDVTEGAPSDRPPTAEPTSVSPSVPIPTILAPIDVGQTPGFVAASPNGRQLYVANRAAGVVTVVDTAVDTVIATIPVPAGPPQFLTFSPDGRQLYISVFDDARTVAAVTVLDTSNSEATTIPVRTRPYRGAVTPDGSRLFVPTHDSGTISVIDTATNTVIAEASVPPNPHWIEFTADGSRAYVANHESNLVTELDPETLEVVAEIPVGTSPHSVAINPRRPLVANVNYDSASVSMIDMNTNTVVATIPVGSNPQDVTWSADGRFAYVATVTEDAVVVVSADSFTVTARLPVGDGPTSVAVLPDGSRAYVSVLNGGVLVPLDLTG